MEYIKNKAVITYESEDTVSNEVVIKIVGIMPIVIKLCDKTQAHEGETVKFTVTVKNPSLVTPMNGAVFSDELDQNLDYVTGTFKVNGVDATPTLTGNELKYTIPAIAANSTLTITFDAEVL